MVNVVMIILLSSCIWLKAMDVNPTLKVVEGEWYCLRGPFVFKDNEPWCQLLEKRFGTKFDKEEQFIQAWVQSEKSSNWNNRGHPELSEGQNYHLRSFPEEFPLTWFKNLKEGDLCSCSFYGEDQKGNSLKPVLIKLKIAQIKSRYPQDRIPFEEFMKNGWYGKSSW